MEKTLPTFFSIAYGKNNGQSVLNKFSLSPRILLYIKAAERREDPGGTVPLYSS